MRWLGTKVVSLSRISKPGNWRQLLREPRVLELARSLQPSDGCIHFPVLNEATMQVVVGRDRIAACALLGLERITVRMVEGTDTELIRLAAIENARRRPPSVEDIRLAVANATEVRAAEPPSENGRHHAGRPPSPVRAAIRQIAEMEGMSEAQARRILALDPPEAAPASEPSDTSPRRPRPLEPLPEVERLYNQLMEVMTSFSLALKALKLLGTIMPPAIVARLDLDPLRHRCRALATDIKRLIPRRLCPYCQRTKEPAKCPACLGTQYLVGAQLHDVPQELAGEELAFEHAGDFS